MKKILTLVLIIAAIGCSSSSSSDNDNVMLWEDAPLPMPVMRWNVDSAYVVKHNNMPGRLTSSNNSTTLSLRYIPDDGPTTTYYIMNKKLKSFRCRYDNNSYDPDECKNYLTQQLGEPVDDIWKHEDVVVVYETFYYSEFRLYFYEPALYDSFDLDEY